MLLAYAYSSLYNSTKINQRFWISCESKAKQKHNLVLIVSLKVKRSICYRVEVISSEQIWRYRTVILFSSELMYCKAIKTALKPIARVCTEYLIIIVIIIIIAQCLVSAWASMHKDIFFNNFEKSGYDGAGVNGRNKSYVFFPKKNQIFFYSAVQICTIVRGFTVILSHHLL